MKASDGRERVRVGCQGWNYDDWVTPPGARSAVFYPRGTRAAAMLDVYARAFDTVEVDSTFYAVPSGAAVEGWHRRTPPGFTFALKLPQLITHQLALGRESEPVLAEFCERARLLKEKLAAVLVQLPPQFEATADNWRVLSAFLPLLPRDIRFHFEFRDPPWFNARVVERLARAGAGLALVEGPWARRERVWQAAGSVGGESVYVRWMGARDLTAFAEVVRPQDENLREWAEVIERLAPRVAHVFAYFSNFYEGHAPASAHKLKRLLGLPAVAPGELDSQPSLF